MFWKKKPVFTAQEVTTLILVAALIDFDKLGLTPDHQARAVVEKAKSIVTITENGTGFHANVPSITIVAAP